MLLNCTTEDKESWFYTKKPEFLTSVDKGLDRYSYKIFFIDGMPISGLPDFCNHLSSPFQIEDDFSKLFTVTNNTANFKGGICLELPEGVVLDRPLDIFYFASKGEIHSCNQFILGKNSALDLVEHFYSLGMKQKHVVNNVARFDLSENSKLRHTIVQDSNCVSEHFYTSKNVLKKGASYEGFYLTSGAIKSRNEIQTFLDEVGASVRIMGISFLSGSQHHDSYMPIYHNSCKAYSYQHFRNILKDVSKAVFYGKIVVPRGSYGTESHQLNKNLLLGEHAQAYTRPELEILNDDVICSHGATVGTVENNVLHYLCSRGISEKIALKMLMEGFVTELLEESGCDNYIRCVISSLLD